MLGAGSVEAFRRRMSVLDTLIVVMLIAQRGLGATPYRGCPSGRGGKIRGWGQTFSDMILTTSGFLWQPTLLEETQRYGSSLMTAYYQRVWYGISIRACDLQFICVRFVKADSHKGLNFNQENLAGKKGSEGIWIGVTVAIEEISATTFKHS